HRAGVGVCPKTLRGAVPCLSGDWMPFPVTSKAHAGKVTGSQFENARSILQHPATCFRHKLLIFYAIFACSETP
ncbi:MAG: hypothetical protein PHO64_09095, partial [Thiomonas sp.]|nr:hypothetical protein [Thiomonas sp.]